MFFLNKISAIFLIISFLSKFVPPHDFWIAGFLSLVYPVLLIVNIFFAIYWIVRFNRKVFLSIFSILITFSNISSLYGFSDKKSDKNLSQKSKNHIRILTYNARRFNKLGDINDKNIPLKIEKLIKNNNPDIICFEEFQLDKMSYKKNYPYFYTMPKAYHANKSHVAVFSKFPILSNKTLFFDNSLHYSIILDLKIKSDTIRVFATHLESFKTSAIPVEINEKRYKKTLKNYFHRMKNTFKIQSNQINFLKKEIKKSPHKTILVGDFNSTPTSYQYMKISSFMKDSFVEKGSGFGFTSIQNKVSLRIDYIFLDERIKALGHGVLNKKYSDHYPIWADFEIN